MKPTNASKLERRVAALEEEVDRLKKQIAPNGHDSSWWRRIEGTFANDPIYEEAMRLGRQYRQSLRPGRKRPKRQKP